MQKQIVFSFIFTIIERMYMLPQKKLKISNRGDCMKRKITVEALLEIENIIQQKKKDGNYDIKKLDNLFNNYKSRNASEEKAFALAVFMPIDEITAAIKQYDESRPKKDELKFIKELSEKYEVTDYDVILRIQYVRRINKKRIDDNK